jgi:BirA family biotin operon repressor/biotin-[acetyl-CoA-carboxylase] ligase
VSGGGLRGGLQIKWPNDIYLQNHKICGLICSQHAQYHKTSIGIGIKTNILNDIPSILSLLNLKINNETYLNTITAQILDNLPAFEQQGLSLFHDFYTTHDYLIGKHIKIDNQQGLYAGINNDGAILLKTEDCQIKTIYSGSVEII